ncbi:DUF4169 family protein [Mesobaculum littorinae]|uniref:DUF4169 family protein n=1 Tax=Mesobaculum littorinae TaxID=2486419 RepID=A0A438AIW1_9RHOB|nr:DUF4169 family protein [Mesobaculum littorinae]RVV98650.1 DUF4169 family protein [Mesobaculum littorinae]
MSTPVNLNRARKERARNEARSRADANAAKFGRTKAQKSLDTARAETSERRLDQLRLDRTKPEE